MYTSPSQSTSGLESFLSNLKELLGNVLCSKSQFTIILDDLNARSQEWWSEDIATLNHLFPMHPSLLPENITKPYDFLFQGVENGYIGNKWVKCQTNRLLNNNA